MATVLFLCPHGGAKSVLAAAYFNQIAGTSAAAAAAVEDAYASVPAPVVAWLQKDGIDVAAHVPRPVEPGDIRNAERIVTIGCSVDAPNAERWDDVPMASEDLPGCVAAIRRHVEALAEELRGR